MLKIDIHAHAFAPKIARKAVAFLEAHYDIPPEGTGLADDLMERIERAGIDRVALHTAATDPSQVVPANNWAIELSRSYPRAISFGTMHPGYPEPEKEFRRLEEAGIKGLKFHPDFQNFRLDDPAFFELMEMIGDRFVLMFHVGDRLPPGENPSCPITLAKVRENFPAPRMIAAHMGGYLHWKWAREHLVGRDVYLDTSSTLAFIDDHMLGEIFNGHPREKILFGSDYPLFDPGEEAKTLKKRLNLTEKELEELMTNAAGLFGL